MDYWMLAWRDFKTSYGLHFLFSIRGIPSRGAFPAIPSLNECLTAATASRFGTQKLCSCPFLVLSQKAHLHLRKHFRFFLP